jgi:Spy/CpxP family protein refolding chaperone
MKIYGGKIAPIALSIFTLVGLSVFAFSADESAKKDWANKGRNFMISRMKKALDLTDDQVAKITTLFKNFKSSMDPLIKTKVKDQMDLRDKLFIGGTDTEIKPLLNAVNADNEKIGEARKNLKDSLNAVLTPTQQAKLLVMRDGMRFHRRHWRDSFRGEDFQ